MKTRTHIVIPDCQVAPGRDISYLSDVGEYIIEKKPEVIVCIGDFFDFPSLNSYAPKGGKELEGKRIREDIDYGIKAMKILMKPLIDYNKKAKELHRPRYKPDLIFTIGNHEERLMRLISESPQLEGMFSYADLKLESFGWKVIPFLEIATRDGVSYTHYVASPNSPRALGTAKAIANAMHSSTIVGHAQVYDHYYQPSRLKNKPAIQCLIAGACYTSDEAYRGAQNQNFWRGILRLSGVKAGDFALMMIPLSYLKERRKK